MNVVIEDENKKNKKIIFITLVVILILAILIIFLLNKTNVKKIGNNSTSQEIVDYILNISSYEAKIEVEVKSNKNTNKYILKQQYISPDVATQEVLEPSNIEKMEITYENNTLKINNIKIDLTTVYENYPYIVDNFLWLDSFVKDYKKETKSGIKVIFDVWKNEDCEIYNRLLGADTKAENRT